MGYLTQRERLLQAWARYCDLDEQPGPARDAAREEWLAAETEVERLEGAPVRYGPTGIVLPKEE